MPLAYTPAAAVIAETFIGHRRSSSSRSRPRSGASTAGSRTPPARSALAGHGLPPDHPAVAPALGAGSALAWARALGEFGATITFAGSFPGRTQTMPLAVNHVLDSRLDATILLSLVLLRCPSPCLGACTTSGLAARRASESERAGGGRRELRRGTFELSVTHQ